MARVNKKDFSLYSTGCSYPQWPFNVLAKGFEKGRIGRVSAPGFRHLTGTSFVCWETEIIHRKGSRLFTFPPSPLFSSLADVPGGFSVSQREEPREGGVLHLTCVANKYLYTALSWRRLNGNQGGHSHTLSGQPLRSGEFSNSLVLFLKNLTTRDSGVYRCSTRHLVTGQETHLDTQVTVTSEYCRSNLWYFLHLPTKHEVITCILCIFWYFFRFCLKNEWVIQYF